jgi:hypothetical protein
MTLIAGDSHVRTREGELGLAVIEGGWLPRSGVMTGLAVGGKPRCDVTGIRRGIELLLMTANARHRRPRIHSINMTGGTGSGHVRAGQGEARCAVIET